MMEEYEEFAFEARYYLTLAAAAREQADEYMRLARDARARAKEVAL